MPICMRCHSEPGHRTKPTGYRGLSVILYILLALFANPLKLFADDWPRLSDGLHDQCADAFQIASTVFESDEFYLFAPPEIPADFGSVLVLKPEAEGISAGNALKADPTVFDKLPIGGAPRSIYWQKTATYGYRLVVKEEPLGWLGDT